MVEIPVSPRDASYIESLDEPWQSIARKAIPAIEGEGSTTVEALPDAASRVDQLELNVRSQFLQLFFELDDTLPVLAKVGLYWKTALDLCVHIVYHATKSDPDPRYVKMETRKLPILLIEDCLDTLSVEDVKKLWADYVEPSLDHPDQLLGDLLWKSSTVCHLPFLRVCNHFLRVLETASHSGHGEWKGRILTALAKGFSIADRSALKFWGSFHSSRVAYEDAETFHAQNNNNNDKKNTKSKSTTATTSPTMDYSLYEAFWSLQADFSNPNRIRVVEFIPKLKAVLEAMESAASRSLESSSSSTTTTTTTPIGTSIRYMTASSLLPTQLATPDFRCCVVSQFLITASHLSAESPPLAKTLTPLLTRAKKLLQADNPEVYHLLWESILAHREEAWRKWKKEKCPVSAFEPKQKPEMIVDPATSKSKLHLARPLTNASELSGDDEYKSLQSGDLVEICQELKRSIPTLEEHMESYVEALDPESGIEAEYHPGNDPLFAWRAMRLFAKHQLSLLKHCRRPADLERVTREWYRLQGKDIPGEMTLNEDDDYDDDNDNDAENDDDAPVEKKTELQEGEEDEDRSQDQGKVSDEEEEKEEHNESPGANVVMTDNNDDDEMHDEGSENPQDNGEEKQLDMLTKIDEKREESADDESGIDQDDDAKSNDAQENGLDEEGKTEQGELGTDDENLEDVDDAKLTQESKTETVDAIPSETKNPLSVSKRFIPPTKRPEPPAAPSREDSADEKEGKSGDSTGGDDSSRKRKRSRSVDRDRQRAPRGPPLESSADDRGPGRGRWTGVNRPAANRGDDGPPRGRGRHEDGPPEPWGQRRDEQPPPRGVRGGSGPPPHRDDGTLSTSRGPSRHDDRLPPRPGRHDGPPPRVGGGRGGDRRDERHHGSDADRRRGRDDSRFRARR